MTHHFNINYDGKCFFFNKWSSVKWGKTTSFLKRWNQKLLKLREDKQNMNDETFRNDEKNIQRILNAFLGIISGITKELWRKKYFKTT